MIESNMTAPKPTAKKSVNKNLAAAIFVVLLVLAYVAAALGSVAPIDFIYDGI